MNTPLVFGGNMYCFGNDIYIHKYSIAEQKWSCIPKAFPWKYQLILTVGTTYKPLPSMMLYLNNYYKCDGYQMLFHEVF